MKITMPLRCSNGHEYTVQGDLRTTDDNQLGADFGEDGARCPMCGDTNLTETDLPTLMTP